MTFLKPHKFLYLSNGIFCGRNLNALQVSKLTADCCAFIKQAVYVGIELNDPKVHIIADTFLGYKNHSKSMHL